MAGSSYFGLIAILIVILILYFLYKKCRKYESVNDLPNDIKGISLNGIVTKVHDGDGFRFYHIPLFGSKEFSNSSNTLPIRLAGIDAPEMGDSFMPPQQLADQAKKALNELVFLKEVRLELCNLDQFQRVLAFCFLVDGNSEINVNVQMVELGMALIYDGSSAEFGNYVQELKQAERRAQQNQKGVWSLSNFERPIDYRKRWRNAKANATNENITIVVP